MSTIPQFLSAFDVAAKMKCSYHAALKHMRAVGVYKIGALVRVREDELQAYLVKCREPDKPASISAPVARGGTATSTAPSAVSRSARRTRPKRDDDLPNVSSIADFLKLRRGREK